MTVTAEPTAKTCTRCGREKELDAFGQQKGGKFGRKAYCRECEAARTREYRWKARGVLVKDWLRLHTRHAQEQNMWHLNALFGGKWCAACETHLPVEEFNANASNASGLQNRCAACSAERYAEYYVARKDAIAERNAEYRAANKDKIAEYKAEYHRTPEGRASLNAATRRYRTLKAGLPIDGSDVPDWLAHAEELDSWLCHLCGGAFRVGDSVEWDHRDPVKGGTAGTVVNNMSPAHAACNSARRNTPLDEWHARVGVPEGIV